MLASELRKMAEDNIWKAFEESVVEECRKNAQESRTCTQFCIYAPDYRGNSHDVAWQNNWIYNLCGGDEKLEKHDTMTRIKNRLYTKYGFEVVFKFLQDEGDRHAYMCVLV